MSNDLADSTDIGGTSCDYAGQNTWVEHNKFHSEQVSRASSNVWTYSKPGFCREDFSDVEKYLKSLGATRVVVYDELEDKSFLERVKEWTGGKVWVDVVLRFRPLIAF